MDSSPCEIVDETDEYINLVVDMRFSYVDELGQPYIQKDFRVGGDVWRVHKCDADPFPSSPHAHCIAGRQSFVGTKLHLGTREIYRGRSFTGLYLAVKTFNQLIDKIRPKFPRVVLPLPIAD